MAAGRFRVKSGVDLDTATRFATDLEVLGAVCTMVEVGGPPATPSIPAPPATPSPMTSALSAARAADATTPAPATSALSAARPSSEQAASPAAEFETGLSAASTSGGSAPDLGALMGADSGTFAISSLDGNDEPDVSEQASSSSAAASSPDVDGDFGQGAADMFAPPEESSEELTLSLAVEQPEVAPVQADPSVVASAHAASTLADAVEAQPAAKPSKKLGNPVVYVASNERARFVAGVLAAMLLGFLPAHFVTGCQESSKFAAIDKNVHAEYAEVKTPEDWDALDEMLAAQKTAKESARTNIAVTGFGAWLLVGGLLGFVWFRKIDWDRFAEDVGSDSTTT